MSACWPLSTTAPVSASRKDEARPPRRGRASSTVTRVPRSARATAAERPAKPPPITTTCAMSGGQLRPSPRRQRKPDALVARQRDALVEDVEATRLDARQEALVDEPHGLRRCQGAAVLGREGPAGAQVVRARPPALEGHQRTDARRVASREELLLVAGEARQVVEREVEPPAGGVLGDVAQDVRELECDAEIAGVVGCGGVPAAEDLDAQEPDGRGHQVAVLLELVEGRVASARQVHLDAAAQIVEVAAAPRIPPP